MPVEALEKGLLDRWPENPDQARLLAHLSGGRPGYAIYLKDHPGILEQRSAWLNEHERLLHSRITDRFDFAEKYSKDKESSRQMLIAWLSYWRDILLRAAGAGASLTNLDQSMQIEERAARLGIPTARSVVAAIEHTLGIIDRNANLRLALEVLLLDLPRL
jgi:DNA polymerase-3 subunit delta'